MVAKKIFSFLIILVCFVALAKAQHYSGTETFSSSKFNIQKVEIEDNFLNSHVNCAYQDTLGFMWFGTINGLCRYDGTEIVKFTTTNSKLPFNNILRILGDDQGNLWLVNTSVGGKIKDEMALINIHTLEIQAVEDLADLGFPTGYCVFEGNDNVIYFMNNNIEIEFEYSNGELKKVETENTPLSQLDNIRKYKRFQKFNQLGIKRFLFIEPKDEYSFFLGIDELGGALFQSLNYRSKQIPRYNLYRISREGEQSNINSHNLYSVTATSKIYYEQSTSNIWSSSNNKLIVANKDDNLYYDFEKEFPNVFYGETKEINFYGDVVWICATNGVFKITAKHIYFDSYLKKKRSSVSLNSSRSIFVDSNGDLLVTTVNNFLKRTKEGIDTINQTRHHPIIEQRGDTILAGNYGICKFVNNKIIDHYFAPETRYTWSFLKSKTKKGYWLGFDKGLGYWEEGMDSLKLFSKYNGFEELKKQYVFDLKYLENGNILVASISGIYELSEEKGILNRYWKGGRHPYHLPISQYHFIYQDNDGVIWLGSQGGGLIKWNKEIGEYEQFTVDHGLSNNNICAIYEDSLNNLWLPSYYGLMKFNKSTEHLKIYTTKDGINDNEFNKASHFRTKDGKLYFGGLNGVNSFYPRDLEEVDDDRNPPMRLIKLYHFDRGTDQIINELKSYEEGKPIRIYSGDGYLNLEYALLDYTTTNNNDKLYAYKIEGLDSDWQYTRENKIKCIGLGYGNYTIRIKGRKGNGYYSSNEISVPFIMVKPIYLRTWFIIGTIFLIVLGIYLFVKERNKWLVKKARELESLVKEQTFQLEKQAQELLELDKIKSRFFANVSHELRTPITLIQGPIHSLLKKDNLDADSHRILKKVEHNTRDLMELVNELLDLTKVEAKNLGLDETNALFYLLINRKFSSFQSMAEMKEIQFSLDYQMDKELRLRIDKSKMEKVLNNLLSNAFKFTPKGGTIQMVVEDLGNDVKIQVKDNGRGIPKEDIPYVFNRFYQSSKNKKAEGGLGIGLALSAEFIKLFGGKLWVESREGEGATFFIQFPKRNATIANEQSEEERHLENEELPPAEIYLAASSVRTSSKELILLVEDHLGLQEYIQAVLKSHYEIKIVGNGKEALTWLKKEGKPSLIISDLMMPVMDGFEFLDAIKKSTSFAHIPCIMLTARADMKDKLKALRIGVDDYITKPFNEDELKARIRNLLMNYDARKLSINGSPTIKALNDAPMISEKDQKWLKNLEYTILEKINHHSFSIDFLAEVMSMNRDKLFKRTKKLVGLTPNQYVRVIRLQLAKRLLENGDCIRVKDVSSKVGFQKVEYFSKLYKEQFGKSPSEYIR